MKPPEALDRIADKVLSYRPKDKAKKLRKKARGAKKGAKRGTTSTAKPRTDARPEETPGNDA